MIDDVDYLLENSEKDSMVIYVDSSLRNKLYYPNANEYTIQFDQPFKNVYGFEVIDGSIPNTMYNIDIYNNDMYLTTVVKSTASLVPINTVLMFTEVHTASTFITMFNQDEENYIAIGSEANLSVLVANVVLTNVSKNYAVFYKASIDGSNIVQQRKQTKEEYYFFKYNNKSYAVEKTGNVQLVSILEAGEYYIDLATMTVYYYTVTYIDPFTFNNIKSGGAYMAIVNNYRRSLAVGNYDILTVTNDLSDIVNPLAVDIEPTTSPPKKEGKMMFSSAHYVVLNAAKGGIIESLGFDTYPPSSETTTNYKSYTIGSNYMVYGGVTDPTSTSLRYRIISPGLINLLGERFCILRIKELEDHLFGSYSYMNFTPGIGMFKMAAGQGGITNLRFDYTSLVRKPFHPIGKVDKLTLRFETAKKYLYDFKGVNHQLMFIIKFLVPSKKEKFTKSILNPNYDPNIMDYMSKHKSIEYAEDSDDEEEFDEDEYYKMYKKELDDMDYSTSSEEYEEEDSEEEF